MIVTLALRVAINRRLLFETRLSKYALVFVRLFIYFLRCHWWYNWLWFELVRIKLLEIRVGQIVMTLKTNDIILFVTSEYYVINVTIYFNA